MGAGSEADVDVLVDVGSELVVDDVDVTVAGTHAERRFAMSMDPRPEA